MEGIQKHYIDGYTASAKQKPKDKDQKQIKVYETSMLKKKDKQYKDVF